MREASGDSSRVSLAEEGIDFVTVVANRIVTQLLAAEPAPVALDVTLPERGTVLTFGRSVQVDGQRPMAITLSLKRNGSGFAWLGVLLCLLLGVMGGARVMKAGDR